MKSLHYLAVFLFLLGGLQGAAQPVFQRSNEVNIDFGVPDLIQEKEIFFNDVNNNNALDAKERVAIGIPIRNIGKYLANNVRLETRVEDEVEGLILPPPKEMGNLEPGQSRIAQVVLEGDAVLASGIAHVKFDIIENEEVATTIDYDLTVLSVSEKPQLVIISPGFYTENNKIEVGKPFSLTFRLKNSGGGVAQNVQFQVSIPPHVLLRTNYSDLVLERMNPGQIVEIEMEFLIGPNYTKTKVPIEVKVTDINKGSGEKQSLVATISQ